MSSFLAAVAELSTSQRTIPTLEQLCIDHLYSLIVKKKNYDVNLSFIEEELVLKLLKRLPVDVLRQIEEYNVEDLEEPNTEFPSEAIWKWHCAREFGKNEVSPQLQEKWFDEYNVTSWKALYIVCDFIFVFNLI